MAVAQRPKPAGAATRSRGPLGNERLTALTGATLIVGLAIVGIAILRFHTLFSLHMFVGAMLVGPLCLKLGSTCYRLGSYYGGRATYRKAGPPHIGFRLLAPLVVVSTLGLFGSGGLMLLLGPSSRQTLVPIHKVLFFVWIALMALHVLAHLPDLWRVLRQERRGVIAGRLRGVRLARFAAIGAAVAVGLLIALLLKPDMSKISQSRSAEVRSVPLSAVSGVRK
ncbi:MAG TPA: hypothetical protein VGF95_06480 [Solirubrobacteraceae bacterium]|jgi:hypothetical protein